ncbi:MAG: hypothetical protein LBT05_04010 [Planctomycetaceae bacterium]|jgi:hypothetical protein|nr:hypothetical protein [Planctomycetaceae bacterium]
MSKRYSISLLLLIGSVVFGCSYGPKKPADLPKLYPVEVSVKFGGKAIEDVKVSLIPVDKSKWSAAGATNSKGIARLSTSFAFSGAPTGRYIIAFSKNQATGTAEDAFTVESEIPLKYGVAQSKETIEIKPQSNKLTFNLDGGGEKKVVKEPTNTGRMPKAM